MTKDTLTGIIAVAVGGIYTATALVLPEMRMGDKLGPKIFPLVVGIGSVLAGLALILGDRRPGKQSKKADFGFVEHKDLWLKIVLTTVVGIVYGLVMDKLGFLIPTTLFMLFISTLINKGRLVQNAVLSAVFAVITYGVFAVALKLSLPRGFLESLLPF
ncbi:MAG TPA: tripartite tricarboxylate transporter TctB family protein [Spirochaetia bacterium]|nr:tripartite tricarboxylate transporter TctB family protein [Spirochaetales bacterium]HRY81740.1 tripartite tricarboxylate transporter TctB family protein [Spirochaetia bacterium]HRZ88009.1 tripartite tricarboxylate transporter TctB family protein [Spirochaetia bacterium]